MGLTKKQKSVLEFIQSYIEENSHGPTYSDIQNHFGFRSKGTVNDYIGYLKKAGHLKNTTHPSVGIELADTPELNVSLPILGKVAAGQPLEVMTDATDMISVPESMIQRGEHYALMVEGESMIDDGILDGDVIVVKSQKTALNGQTVVALVNGAATVKKFFKFKDNVELHPANATMKPILVEGGEFELQGLVVGLMRSY